VENERRTTPKRRRALAQAITLIESQSLEHIQQADLLLNYVVSTTNTMDPNTKSSCCYPRHSGQGGRKNSCDDMDFQKTEFRTDKKDSSSDIFRLGFAGAQGAGKSSLIESLGKYILDDDNDDKKHKLAVVCIDPSSSITGGSILGDKTRMMELSRHPRAFVRPSPSKGVLGGLSSYTNDVVTLCGAAGYDLVFVETVGSGQSEIDINQAVDMLVLVVSPGSGDGLQGVKKGILEVADLIVVNKADGSMLPAARTTAADYKGATHFFKSRMEGWETPPVLLASAETGYGLEQLWGDICRYRDVMTNNGYIQKRRAQQARYWMWKHVQELITAKIQSDENIRALATDLETALDQGFIAPRAAASELLRLSTKPNYPSTSHEK
jgi:LAO/AO transport system kinase